MSGNFLKIKDLVTFSLANSNLIRIKDDYEGAFKPDQQGQTHPSGMGTTSQVQPQGLQIRIAATHAGIITRNNGFYLPDKMKKGTSSFTDNYPAPVLVHHKDTEDNIGRIVASQYLDTSGAVQDQYRLVNGLPVKDRHGKEVGIITDVLLRDFVSDKMPFGMQVDTVCTLLRDSLLSDKDYAGLGHIQIVANISDQSAINKLLDGRYLTGSVGATTDRAVCSICRQDWTESGQCEHKPGGIYDGAKAFIIAGNLNYEEYSFVNVPADRHSKVLELNYNGIQDSIEVANDYLGRIYEVQLAFPQYDSVSEEEKGMTKKREDALNKDLLEGTPEVVINDSTTPEPQPVDAKPIKVEGTGETQVADATNTSEKTVESADNFLTRVIGTDTLSSEDEEKLYNMVSEKILDFIFEDNAEVADTDLDKITAQMEKYAEELDGEDGEIEVVDDEDVEDATKDTDKPGGSNAGKYKKGPFCGPAGGAPKGTYPVNTVKRAKAALAYARHAPNPSGIRNCVCRHYPSLPSCQKGKDSLLTKIQRDALPVTTFCGPNRTFPIKDELHFRATLAILDNYKGEADFTEVRKSVERKGKVKGFKVTDKTADAKSADTETIIPKSDETKDSLEHGRIMHMVIQTLEEAQHFSKEPVLEDTELKVLQNLLQRLAKLVGKDALQNALQEEGLIVAQNNEQVLVDEVVENEETICNLRDQLDKLREEYAQLHGDMETLQDSLVQANVAIRKAKEAHLTTLVTLRDTKVEDRDWTELEDAVVDSELETVLKNVDMTKITDKLGDGMSRIPTGEVEGPANIQDEAQKSKFSLENLKVIEDTYIAICLQHGEIAGEAYLERMKKEGKLPQDEE